MPTKESKADFDLLVSKYSDEVRALAAKTRKLVLEIMPTASEKTYWGWSNTWYGTSEKNVDAIFAVSPQKAYVSLFFCTARNCQIRMACSKGQARNYVM